MSEPIQVAPTPAGSTQTPTSPPKTSPTVPSLPRNPIRILLLAQVGTIGKSTIAAVVLHPHLKGSFYSIESFNQDAARYGVQVERFLAEQDDLKDFQKDLTNDPRNAVIDIGQSALDVFLKRMAVDRMVEDFDYVVSVADTTDRGQDEAINVWEKLMALGFEPEQYRLVLNRSQPKKLITAQYSRLFAYKEVHKEFWVNGACILPELNVFNEMASQGVSWNDALSPGVDFLTQSRELRHNGREKEARKAAERALLQKWARGAAVFTEAAFYALDIPV
ncbi:hypothetical protein AWB69_07784 [Caballeronia udeis]|uniref:Uncharacterized protein n=1 Tax=Caballeronia udeis TaxID=1232866 RepID=A0A158JGF9_9BURK|nr:hypothetical protein [Caballeronia udeis]SAL67553.1 hypothetical protein AWB69_07784 [Caballeronia udeis]